MTHKALVEHTVTFVKNTLKGAEGGHDWFHIERVFKTSLKIAEKEKVDKLVVSLGALLHDIADSKFNDGDETVGPTMAKSFLESLGADQAIVDHVVNIIKSVSFKNSLENGDAVFQSRELEVIQDADRLDAIGAIGVARTFNYGGYKNRPLYHPDIPPNPGLTKAQYKNQNSPTINHFYEKLLLLKEGMNTSTGKQMAAERHQFMLDFLERFYKEWEGEW